MEAQEEFMTMSGELTLRVIEVVTVPVQVKRPRKKNITGEAAGILERKARMEPTSTSSKLQEFCRIDFEGL